MGTVTATIPKKNVPADFPLVSWAIYIGGAALVGALVYWSEAQMSRPMECIGTHTVGRAHQIDPATIVTIPTLGNESYKIEMGPACKNAAAAALEAGGSGPVQVCVGNALKTADASQAPDSCKILAINVISQSRLGSYFSKQE